MKYTISISSRVETMADSLTIRELLDQLICPAAAHDALPKTPAYGALYMMPGPQEALATALPAYRQRCAIPPLVTSDMESGPGEAMKGATLFPAMAGCGVANSADLAYAMGRAAALEGAAAGYNWTLAPCADIAREIDSPVVSSRSAGRDPDRVIKITGAYIRGLQEHGMMATAKHFPGDGFSVYDQHLTTPVNPLSRRDWRRLSGKVFQALVDQGVMAVMPGHIALPAFDRRDPKLKLYPPATLSKPLMTDLLKGELGFDGIIVSDAIIMGGAVGFKNYYDACALFWENGGDILLFPRMDEAFYREMEERLCRGLLTEATLRNRVARVLAVKEQMGLLAPSAPAMARPLAVAELRQNEATANKMADRCVRVVRDREHVIPFPLTPETRVLHVILGRDEAIEEGSLYRQFTGMIAHRSPKVTELIDPGPWQLFERVCRREFDLVICSVITGPSYGVNVVRLYGTLARNMMGGWMKLGTPVVFVAHQHPFVHLEYEAAMDTIVNTHGSTPYSLERLLRGITGEQRM